MRCPHCAEQVIESWQPLYANTTARGTKRPAAVPHIPHDLEWDDDDLEGAELFIEAEWMECPNEYCGMPIVAIEKYIVGSSAETDDQVHYHERWFAYPRLSATRTVDNLIPEEFAKPYREAAAILELSPNASAAIARRILADVLKAYGYPQFQLSKQIEAFAQDPHHPSALRENARYLVQIGDFGTHTQIDASGEIVDVAPEEAEWSLDVLDGLFEYFIIGPKKDEARRAAMDQKLDRTGRRPIRRSESPGA